MYRLPKRLTEELFADMCGIKIALGSISKLEQATASALCAAVAEASAFVQSQPVAHADETGWTEDKRKAWLHVAATPDVAVFDIRQSRGAQVAKELLGEQFVGHLVSDRWCGYNWVDPLRRQVCWAHLLRDFESFRDYGLGASRLASQIQKPARKILHLFGPRSRRHFESA